MWRLAPINSKLGAWRYQSCARRFLLHEKYEKIAFFTVFASPGRVTLAARRFFTKKKKTQNWVITHASLGGTFKSARRFLGIFPETRKHRDLGLCRASWSYIAIPNNHKACITWRNSPNLLILAQNGGIKTSVVPSLVQPWPSPITLYALINFHITLNFRPSFPLSNSFFFTPSRFSLFLHPKTLQLDP